MDRIDVLARTQPRHPYSLAGQAKVRAALDQFLTLTREIGLLYSGSANAGENLWLPSPVGAGRPTLLAPQAQLTADLRHGEPMLIVGLRGLVDFYPELIAENLNKQGHRARAAFIPLDLLTDRGNINTAQLAQMLDAADSRRRLGAELKRLAQPGERIGLPAILGMDQHTAVMRELQVATGAPVFEIPTLPPSVPGIRLNTAIRRKLERLGVREDINMDVKGFHSEEGRVLWVESATSGRPLKHSARHFLLATGGILGGGIQSDHTGNVQETVFHLPLTLPATREKWFRPQFFDPSGQPIFQSGVEVDRSLQPINADQSRVYANVWAAGALLAHSDPILERSLEGIAIVTGTAAAESMLSQSNSNSSL
jgi:glycerol-3-phosphate dehydrogenase subunit B